MDIEGDFMDYSSCELQEFPKTKEPIALKIKHLSLYDNDITVLPRYISSFCNLVSLDISNNQLQHVSEQFSRLTHLQTFEARNNCLDTESIPKDFANLVNLVNINLSGNRLTEIPDQFLSLPFLQCLSLGGNQIHTVPRKIRNLSRLEILHLGGNRLSSLPVDVGFMSELRSLNLADNALESLPSSLISLQQLESLHLHGNKLSTLPPQIVDLRNLVELSLRHNPLVVRFVQDMVFEPPSLLELAGRVVKIKKVPYSPGDVPQNLYEVRPQYRRARPYLRPIKRHWGLSLKKTDFLKIYRNSKHQQSRVWPISWQQTPERLPLSSPLIFW